MSWGTVDIKTGQYDGWYSEHAEAVGMFRYLCELFPEKKLQFIAKDAMQDHQLAPCDNVLGKLRS